MISKKGIAKEIIIWQQSVYVFSIESDTTVLYILCSDHFFFRFLLVIMSIFSVDTREEWFWAFSGYLVWSMLITYISGKNERWQMLPRHLVVSKYTHKKKHNSQDGCFVDNRLVTWFIWNRFLLVLHRLISIDFIEWHLITNVIWNWKKYTFLLQTLLKTWKIIYFSRKILSKSIWKGLSTSFYVLKSLYQF